MERMDDRPFGTELARQVSERLFRGFALIEVHRDYCGVGLYHDARGVFAAEVNDGLPGREFARWQSQEELARFLAGESDQSMGRAPGSAAGFETDDPWRQGNQTLTRERLEAFVREVDGGTGKVASMFIDEPPRLQLMLQEVLDRVRLLRFLRDETGFQMKEAHGLMSQVPVALFSLSDLEDGKQWIERFAEAGGRCTVLDTTKTP